MATTMGESVREMLDLAQQRASETTGWRRSFWLGEARKQQARLREFDAVDAAKQRQTSDEPPAKPVDRVIGVVGVGVLVAIVGGLIQ
jgi:hypothetical protein